MRPSCPLESIGLLVVHPHGRAGSLFIQSLFDGHPAVVTLPHFGPLYGGIPRVVDEVWSFLEIFIARVPHIFDSSEGYFGKGSDNVAGAFGPTSEDHLKVDLSRLRAAFARLLSVYELDSRELKRSLFFRLFHLAYAEAAGKRSLSSVRYVLYHPHRYQGIEALRAEFPELFFIAMTRDPRQDWESWRKVLALRINSEVAELSRYFLLRTASVYSNDVYNLRRLAELLGPKRLRIIDLERLHTLGPNAMQALCDWLGIEFDECLIHSTFNGEIWAGNSAERKVSHGFRGARHRGAFEASLSQQEVRILSHLLQGSVRFLRYDYGAKGDMLVSTTEIRSALGVREFALFLRQGFREIRRGGAHPKSILRFFASEFRTYATGGYWDRLTALQLEQRRTAGFTATDEFFL
jgi:sulfotransferase family protein